MPAGVFNACSRRNSEAVKPRLLGARTRDAKVTARPKQELNWEGRCCRGKRRYNLRQAQRGYFALVTIRPDAALQSLKARGPLAANRAPTGRGQLCTVWYRAAAPRLRQRCGHGVRKS